MFTLTPDASSGAPVLILGRPRRVLENDLDTGLFALAGGAESSDWGQWHGVVGSGTDEREVLAHRTLTAATIATLDAHAQSLPTRELLAVLAATP